MYFCKYQKNTVIIITTTIIIILLLLLLCDNKSCILCCNIYNILMFLSMTDWVSAGQFTSSAIVMSQSLHYNYCIFSMLLSHNLEIALFFSLLFVSPCLTLYSVHHCVVTSHSNLKSSYSWSDHLVLSWFQSSQWPWSLY